MDHTEQNLHIQAGDTVEIIVGSIAARTTVEEVVDDTLFWVSQPTHQLVPIYYREQEECLVYFFRPSGMYSFRAHYIKRDVRDGFPVVQFQKVGPVEKNQKRFAYRLPVALTGTLQEKDPNGWQGLKEEEYNILTANLSVDGILFRGDFRLEPGSHVLLTLNLSETESLILEAEILRFERRQNQDEHHRMAGRFENMSKRDQARLSRFIMNQQVIERRLRPD
ncbi:PilZ domain-containing protein [Eubacteriales bacterium OttesenSCG-928-M02]|nr:PilZ domain-containing protein [Eubacteriales bacterium OttesenSCG-928-M02]